MKCEMIRRKPFPVYSVVDGTRKAFLVKNEDDGIRCKRWKLLLNDKVTKFFKSKRAALHFFKTGEKFETKPVFSFIHGKRSAKRVM